ncbi:hypothetical protein HRI_001430600 [Hibiscus trionum]|uniref:Uncharacterized protein n=1 Tax=Hibiscus trionum TaxID=183268 RepID=A0A9W7LV11_HIBTR|nr:hypothetical protein HRI_001430600 [Hibiscus trionum]
MANILKSCMQSTLKAVNLIIAMVGIAMILYGFWMLRVWQRDKAGSSFDDLDSTAPWFRYTFLATGATLCLLTCLGHIAADTANGFCLFCVSFFIEFSFIRVRKLLYRCRFPLLFIGKLVLQAIFVFL